MCSNSDSQKQKDDRPLVDKAKSVVQKLRKAGHEAYFAGGCVRDMLLGRKAKDYDIATSAIPDQVIALFPHTIPLGAQFGVIQVRYGGEGFEVATFRSDVSYSDGRRPDAVTFVTAKEDVERRDFTINGLLYDPHSDTVQDHVGGQADIESKVIRAIGDASARFQEDRLRMLRAIRFAARLDFAIEEKTFEAIRSQAGAISEVSEERVRDELWKTFSEGGAHRGLPLLQDSGLLPHVLSELPENALSQWAARTEIVETLPSGKPLLVLAFLLYPAPASTAIELAERLRLSKSERLELAALLEGMQAGPSVSKADLPPFKRFLRQPKIDDICTLLSALAKLGEVPEVVVSTITGARKEFSEEDLFPSPLLDGSDLQVLGYTPGPLFKEALERLEDAQLTGAVSSREEAETLIADVFTKE